MATTEPVGTLIPSLPDDVALDCLARVPRTHHATLSHVSRAIRTAVSSPPFFAARCRLRCTEPVLYIFLRSSLSPSFIFSLDLHSDSQSNHPRSLTPVPAIPEAAVGSAYAAVGPTIYVLGGSINDISTARVWALDCRFNRWRLAPSMRVGREFAAAGVVDGKIYVMGGCVVDTWFRSDNWAEVFDTLTGTWKPVASPVEVREKWMHASAMIDGKIYAMADRGGAVYDARSGAWESVESNLDMGWRGRACVVDGILYCYDYLGKIRGYNVEEKAWRELRGVERGLPRFLCGATMANVGEKLVVVWEEKGSGMEIWCAEIRVEKRDGGRELWGQIAWAGKVGCVPSGSCIVQCLAVAG